MVSAATIMVTARMDGSVGGRLVPVAGSKNGGH
jgi:hypothetical protein